MKFNTLESQVFNTPYQFPLSNNPPNPSGLCTNLYNVADISGVFFTCTVSETIALPGQLLVTVGSEKTAIALPPAINIIAGSSLINFTNYSVGSVLMFIFVQPWVFINQGLNQIITQDIESLAAPNFDNPANPAYRGGTVYPTYTLNSATSNGSFINAGIRRCVIGSNFRMMAQVPDGQPQLKISAYTAGVIM